MAAFFDALALHPAKIQAIIADKVAKGLSFFINARIMLSGYILSHFLLNTQG